MVTHPPPLTMPQDSPVSNPDSTSSIPFLRETLALRKRVLPITTDQENRDKSLPIHMVSFAALETRGRVRPFFFRNEVRPEGNAFLFKFSLVGTGFLEDHSTGETHKLEPGFAFLVPFPSNTAYYCSPGKTWTFMWLLLVGEPSLSLAKEIVSKYGFVYDFRGFPQVLETMGTLYQHRLEMENYDTYYLSGLVYRILMNIVQLKESLSEQIPATIFQACQYMRAIMGESNVSIEDVAAKVGYSKFHFTRKFRQHMRIGPHQYLTKLRLEKAVDLITTTDLPIKIISERVGFNEITHFYRIFKKHMQVTPCSLNRPPH
jgi:AraC-like DNA-binding protein